MNTETKLTDITLVQTFKVKPNDCSKDTPDKKAILKIGDKLIDKRLIPAEEFTVTFDYSDLTIEQALGMNAVIDFQKMLRDYFDAHGEWPTVESYTVGSNPFEASKLIGKVAKMSANDLEALKAAIREFDASQQ